MFATLISLALVSLNVGDVRTIPADMSVYQPGRANWKDPAKLLRRDEDVVAAVVRIDPDGMAGVLEVALLDGTSRFGWLEPSPPGTVYVKRTPLPTPIIPGIPSSMVSSDPDKPYAPRVKRRYPRQDHNAIAAETAAMVQAGSMNMAAAARQVGPIPFAGVPRNAGMGMGGLGNIGGYGGSAGGGSHLCGAPTKTTGAPCRNPVRGPGFCHLHGG
jgi:hypothetical protein